MSWHVCLSLLHVLVSATLWYVLQGELPVFFCLSRLASSISRMFSDISVNITSELVIIKRVRVGVLI